MFPIKDPPPRSLTLETLEYFLSANSCVSVVTLPQEYLHHPLTSQARVSSSRGLSQLSSEFTHHNCD